MSKWILRTNSESYVFDRFVDAVAAFKTKISNYIEENKGVFDRDGMPFAPGAFFSGKYDEGTITDEEIVVQIRTSMLCGSFIWKDAEHSKENAIKSLKGDIHYEGENEFDEKLRIDIKTSPEEVVLDITHHDGVKDETYMRSNALILDNPSKDYYFESHQIVTTSTKRSSIGKIADLEISLKQAKYYGC